MQGSPGHAGDSAIHGIYAGVDVVSLEITGARSERRNIRTHRSRLVHRNIYPLTL